MLLTLLTVLTLMSAGVSTQRTPSLEGPIYLTSSNSTDHNRYLGTVYVLKAIFGQLQQINAKMGGNSSSGQLSGKIISGVDDPFSSGLVVTAPLRDCPPALRKRFLDELNSRRAEEGLSQLRFDHPLARQAHALAAAQSDNAGSPKYSSSLRDLRDYGQYAAGLVAAASGGDSQISLRHWSAFSGWPGVPVEVSFSGRVTPMETDTWKRVTAVGLACDAAQLPSGGKYKFWVAALFKA